MTLATTSNRIDYPGAGSAGPFAFPWRIQSTDDLVVIRRSSTGAETDLAYTTDYALTAGVSAGDATGSITLVAVLAVGEILTILRQPATTQPSSFRNQAAYAGSSHEDALDRLAMEIQSLQEQLDRSVGVLRSYANVSTRVAPETGKALVWQSPTELGNSTIDSSGIAVPGAGRTVATTTAYLLNNAVYNVKDYGAVGNGVADDTLKIQAAIDAAGSGVVSGTTSGDGGVVYFPKGTYKITAKLTVGPHVRLEGAGMFSTVLAGAVSDFVIKIGTDSAVNLAYGCGLERMTIVQSSNIGSGVQVKGTCAFSMKDVILEGPGAGSTQIGLYIDGGNVANIFTSLVNVDSHYFKYCVRLGSSGSSTTTSVTAHGVNVIALTGAGHVGILVDAGNGAQSRFYGGNAESCNIGIQLGGFGVYFFGMRFEGNTTNVQLDVAATANSFIACGGLNDGTVTDNSGVLTNRFYGNLTGSHSDYADRPNALSDGLKFAQTGNVYRSELDRPPGGVAIANNADGTIDIGRDNALLMVYDAGVTGHSALLMVNLVAATVKIVSQSSTNFTLVRGTASSINLDINAGAFRIQNKLGADTTLDAIVLKLHIN